MHRSRLTTLAFALLLAGCGRTGGPTPAPPAPTASPKAESGPATVDDPALGLRLAVPAGMQLRRDFKRDYLDAGAWQAFAGPDGSGKPVAALVLDGSNKITAAELRIGTSADAQAMAHCLDVPPNAKAGSTSTRSLGGVAFQHFEAGDAAMSHYMRVDAYRAIRGDRCVAVDLLITGTRPEVYDPPATPPFSQDQARKALQQALSGLHWTNG